MPWQSSDSPTSTRRRSNDTSRDIGARSRCTATGCWVHCTMPRTRRRKPSCTAWRGRRGFEGRSSFRAWLYRIATNTCLRTLERRGRARRLLPESHAPATDRGHRARARSGPRPGRPVRAARGRPPRIRRGHPVAAPAPTRRAPAPGCRRSLGRGNRSHPRHVGSSREQRPAACPRNAPTTAGQRTGDPIGQHRRPGAGAAGAIHARVGGCRCRRLKSPRTASTAPPRRSVTGHNRRDALLPVVMLDRQVIRPGRPIR
jgi:hypothetical protein